MPDLNSIEADIEAADKLIEEIDAMNSRTDEMINRLEAQKMGIERRINRLRAIRKARAERALEPVRGVRPAGRDRAIRGERLNRIVRGALSYNGDVFTGIEIGAKTGLRSGVVYPAVNQLIEVGFLEEVGRRPRQGVEGKGSPVKQFRVRDASLAKEVTSGAVAGVPGEDEPGESSPVVKPISAERMATVVTTILEHFPDAPFTGLDLKALGMDDTVYYPALVRLASVGFVEELGGRPKRYRVKDPRAAEPLLGPVPVA